MKKSEQQVEQKQPGRVLGRLLAEELEAVRGGYGGLAPLEGATGGRTRSPRPPGSHRRERGPDRRRLRGQEPRESLSLLADTWPEGAHSLRPGATRPSPRHEDPPDPLPTQ